MTPLPSATPCDVTIRMSTVLGAAAAAAPATVPFDAGAVPVVAGTDPRAGELVLVRAWLSSRA